MLVQTLAEHGVLAGARDRRFRREQGPHGYERLGNDRHRCSSANSASGDDPRPRPRPRDALCPTLPLAAASSMLRVVRGQHLPLVVPAKSSPSRGFASWGREARSSAGRRQLRQTNAMLAPSRTIGSRSRRLEVERLTVRLTGLGKESLQLPSQASARRQKIE
ncbi:hypothetical protein ON010_g18908 [Phytophthora cinnamomi]|nr:hypothetical protein ON010_g18908 [Phytophthora cinnamomi]